MKKLLCLVLLACFFAPMTYARDSYISDKLFTYVHSGPSNDFRIIGSVNAGEPIQVLSNNKSSGFTQIIDSKGRKGWVESKYVTQDVSMSIRLPEVEKELAIVKDKLDNAEQTSDTEKAGLISSLKLSKQQITDLETNYRDINQQLTESQEEVRSLRAKIDTQKEDLLLRYFMYGGGVAGLGLLFGLVLPHIIPRRKKNNGGWA
ncbi:TIGR04211 family SH3 domain-containing protein [Vibrio rumoiensis]|uniref:Arylsulfatase n=1 Tax=Vibrio rumoiensis 1S-45 TaxID=1188252 RepID=A0A1E5E231_9VIBR|nr:TIGR04211 family SH3 domain-containing protein [Vibrio rumoiensis]OEF25475.1 arylsulfatase [Vibrio rumoiensis 1S-45]